MESDSELVKWELTQTYTSKKERKTQEPNFNEKDVQTQLCCFKAGSLRV